MPEVDVNGVRLHYEDAGSGTPVLLLHNAFGTARSVFDGLIEFLADHQHRVIAPDFRGYGGSRPPGREFPPDYYQRDTADVAALLRALDCGPVHVAGISDGAIVGLLLAADHPDLVRSLLTWAANAEFPPEERGAYEQLRGAGHSAEFAHLMHERHGMDPPEARAMLEAFVDRALAITDGPGDVGLRDRLGRIEAPVLIGFGERGDFLPEHHAALLNRALPHAWVWMVPHAGHFWPMSPAGREVFGAHLLDWIARHE